MAAASPSSTERVVCVLAQDAYVRPGLDGDEAETLLSGDMGGGPRVELVCAGAVALRAAFLRRGDLIAADVGPGVYRRECSSIELLEPAA